jgi:outer membrane protein
MRIKNRYLGLCLVMLAIMNLRLYAQDPLEKYVELGLAQNITLQQQQISYEKALAGLAEAKSYFFPTASLQGGYQTGGGGRTIQLPVGDLLNPVYQTLNQLTQSSAFPSIQNETITFLPRNYYDLALKSSLPLLHTDLKHQRDIHQTQVGMSLLEIDRYKRALIKDIKVAYFQVQRAYQAIRITQSALDLALASQQVHQKLLEAGKGLPAYLQKAKAEVAEAQHQHIQAQNQWKKAKYYFNSLLNREADAQIDGEENVEEDKWIEEAQAHLHQQTFAVTGREEIKLLESGLQIYESLVKKEKQYIIPQVYAFGQFGAQAEGLKVNEKAPYYIVGVQMEWNVFAGNRHKHKIRQSQLDGLHAQRAMEKAKLDLEMSQRMAFDDLSTAIAQYYSAKEQAQAAAAYKRLIDKGYEEGMNSHLESIEARNAWTQASLALIMSTFQVRIAQANLEREKADKALPTPLQ